MCQFIESIFYRNGVMPLLHWHEQRFAATQFYAFGNIIYPSLMDCIAFALPEKLEKNLTYKCRVLYSQFDMSVTFDIYQKKKINALHIVKDDNIDYGFKFADRSPIENLKTGLAAHEDILILKNGLLTDSSFTNIALYDGNNWLTPAYPLLEGVQRAKLLSQNLLIPADIESEDLQLFSKIRLFNALVNWENAWEIDMRNVH